MSYTALYRKYRPKTFDEVYGQSAIVQTLRNQIINNRIGHAYLFCGPRGTGKTSIAKIFAKAINCSNPVNGNPCLSCSTCSTFATNSDIIEIDAASNNGVDNIRAIIDESKYMPQNGKYKVYIIDEVHMLSTGAFNALLKTLEEPVSNVVFILATTEHNKVPATIASRCQRYNFKLMQHDELTMAMQSILVKENTNWDIQAIDLLAKLSNGGMRDALSLLDQCLCYGNKITYDLVKETFGLADEDAVIELANHIKECHIQEAINILDTMYYNGIAMDKIADGLYDYYKQQMLSITTDESIVYQRYMRILSELIGKMKYDNMKRTSFEIAIIKLCTPETEQSYDALYQRIYQLEHMQPSTSMVNPNEFIYYENVACDYIPNHIYYT